MFLDMYTSRTERGVGIHPGLLGVGGEVGVGVVENSIRRYPQ